MKMIKILILSADPINTPRRRLDQEVREIEEGIKRSKYRDGFEIKSKWAVTFRSMRRAMLDEEPDIVHFCGHGKKDGLMVEDENGYAILVNTQLLIEFFQLFAKKVKCILLNACYSELQAKAIRRHIQYVFGMPKDIEPKLAIEFAVGFYDALGAGKSYEEAYQFGQNAVNLHGIPKKRPLVFLCHSHKDKTLFAEPLAKDLKKYGMDVWYDGWSVLGGDPLLSQISRGIKECDYFIVLLTPNSIESRWVEKELDMAFERCNKDETQIIPIILGDCLIPDPLKSFIYVDFGNHYASGLKELLQLMGITSRIFSETQMINSILKMLPARHKKHINKYVFSSEKPVEQVVKELKRKDSLCEVMGLSLAGFAIYGNLSSQLETYGLWVKYGVILGLVILGFYILERFSSPKYAVERYAEKISRFQELSRDIEPDIHLRNPGELYYKLLDEKEKKFYQDYCLEKNDKDISLGICKKKYWKLAVMDLMFVAPLLLISLVLPETPNVIDFFLTLAIFWGIYLCWQYRLHTNEINETHKLKKEFIEYLESAAHETRGNVSREGPPGSSSNQIYLSLNE